MKRIITAITLLALASGALAADNYLNISSGKTSLVLKANVGEEVQTIYFGPTLADINDAVGGSTFTTPAYPAFGHSTLKYHTNNKDYAIAATHADGNMSLSLAVESISYVQEASATVTRILTKDTVYPFYVTLCYRTFTDSDVIEAWTEIENKEKKTVLLRRFDSLYLPFLKGDSWISTMYGDWSDESRLQEYPVPQGEFSVFNRDGIRNSQSSHAEVMISLDGKPSEKHGAVLGAALCYSGNYQLRTIKGDRHQRNRIDKFFAGIDPCEIAYPLAPKELFVTPKVAFAYSLEGKGGVTRSFHDWARGHQMIHGKDTRMVLLNSWEGVYFDVNEPKMAEMMKDAKTLGGELFVMDDGWFGRGEFSRNDGNSGLGDWFVDKKKLPHGIPWLVDQANRTGIKFGIWIEPEMANTKSELYTKHPDWILNAPGRNVIEGRGTQVILNLGLPAVQDYVFGIVDGLKKENPDLAYIKWDCNMQLASFGVSDKTPEAQAKLYIDYHKGLESVCERIRAKYPDMVIQACASGGGRANYGTLKYFDEFWASDNSDAYQRIYIQWGTSMFFTAQTMAAHISASPNHQTGRIMPLSYRAAVAMSGRLGIELLPSQMTAEEYELCKKCVSDYKSIRNIVQLGDLYRLVSPYENKGLASLMYVSKDKSEAVFYEWEMEHLTEQGTPRVKLDGLDPARRYRITRLASIDGKAHRLEGKVFSGAYLMNTGIEGIFYWDGRDKAHGFGSCVLKLTAE